MATRIGTARLTAPTAPSGLRLANLIRLEPRAAERANPL